VDAITGEGLCLTFHRRARWPAISKPASRQARWPGMKRSTGGCAAPGLHGRYVAADGPAELAAPEDVECFFHPAQRLFGMLAMHVGALPPASFAANCLALGWGLLTQA